MNYFELHIGDYDSATAHLTVVEDGIYGRLLRVYYRTEAPIPADVKQVCRLVRAASKQERDAVRQVLEEFFVLREDGWHNVRCDSEIATFIDGEPEREIKAANEKNRLQRHREERATLFKRLTDAGQHAAWNIPMGELRALVQRLEETPDTFVPPLPATAPATPATATQTPVPRHQTPDTNPKEGGVPPSGPSPYGELAKRFKAVGIVPNSSHQDFRALVDAGATWEEFEGHVPRALEADKPFLYLVATVVGERKRAATRGPMPGAARPTESAYAREQRERAEAFAPSAARRAPGIPATIEAEVTDVTPRALGR